MASMARAPSAIRPRIDAERAGWRSRRAGCMRALRLRGCGSIARLAGGVGWGPRTWGGRQGPSLQGPDGRLAEFARDAGGLSRHLETHPEQIAHGKALGG